MGSQNVWVLRHDDHTHELVMACLINDKYVIYNSLLYCTFEMCLFSPFPFNGQIWENKFDGKREGVKGPS
jgi:hypothetical protein